MSSTRTPSRCMSALYWLCGMERKTEGDNPVTPPAPEQTACSLEEKPRLKLLVNINLIICLSVTAFIIGYWAWQAGFEPERTHWVGKNLCTVFFFSSHLPCFSVYAWWHTGRTHVKYFDKSSIYTFFAYYLQLINNQWWPMYSMWRFFHTLYPTVSFMTMNSWFEETNTTLKMFNNL